MLNGLGDKVWAAFIGIPLAWVGSFEWRLRGKVNQTYCDRAHGALEKKVDEVREEVKKQGDRIIEYLLDNR